LNAKEISEIEASLARRLNATGTATQRSAIYVAADRALRVEFQGNIGLRERSVEILVAKNGSIHLGAITR
jgi:hypothetical protein